MLTEVKSGIQRIQGAPNFAVQNLRDSAAGKFCPKVSVAPSPGHTANAIPHAAVDTCTMLNCSFGLIPCGRAGLCRLAVYESHQLHHVYCLKESVWTAALPDSKSAEKARVIARDVIEYLDSIDFNKYYDSLQKPSARTGESQKLFLDFSLSSIRAAKARQ